jgi:hypothetical protein
VMPAGGNATDRRGHSPRRSSDRARHAAMRLPPSSAFLAACSIALSARSAAAVCINTCSMILAPLSVTPPLPACATVALAAQTCICEVQLTNRRLRECAGRRLRRRSARSRRSCAIVRLGGADARQRRGRPGGIREALWAKRRGRTLYRSRPDCVGAKSRCPWFASGT